MQRSRLVRALAIPLALGFLAAACGGSDDDGSSSPDDTGAEATSPPATSGGGDDTAPEGSTPDKADGDVDTSIVRDDEAERSYGGDIVMGLEADAPGFRPWEDGCSEPCVNMYRTVFDTLTQQTAEGDYQGWLAESVESNDDFTVWTVTLRPDVVFHDGTPLTAQTIADMFPIQQTGPAGSTAIASANVANVEATGDLEVTYTLSAPNSPFAGSLAGTLGRVFEPGAAAADPDGFSTDPIGTGPFMMDKRDIDNETIVVRNPNYWMSDEDGNQLPYLDSVTFRPIPDEGTRLDALISGTVDMFQTLRQNTVRDAREESGIDLYEFQGNNSGGGMFNTAIPPFDDLRVRTGLNHLNDQKRVIEALGGTGISLPATQWFSPDSPWYTEAAAETYTTFDFEAGVASLQEYIDDPTRSDGKAVGEKIDVELSCPPDPTLIAAMQVIEQVWSGSELVDVTLTQFDQATHITNAINDAHHAHCWRWGSNADPSLSINPFVAPPEESVSNFPNYFDQESYDLSLEAVQTDDFEARKDIYSQIMVNINEANTLWYSGYTATAVGADPSIQGINGWLLPDGQLGNGFPSSVVSFQEVYLTE